MDYSSIRRMPTLRERDAVIEEFWERFEDIPMNPETECMEEEFCGFPVGTKREDIWHFVDQRHSRGVAYLLYRDGANRTPELDALGYRNLLCEDCDADCIYNPEGICRFPLVYGRRPDVNDEDGCNDCLPGYYATEGP